MFETRLKAYGEKIAAQAREEGLDQGKRVMVQRMHRRGLSLEEIADYTGLSTEEIAALLKPEAGEAERE